MRLNSPRNSTHSRRGQLVFSSLIILGLVGMCQKRLNNVFPEHNLTEETSPTTPRHIPRSITLETERPPSFGCSGGEESFEIENDGTVEGLQEATLKKVAECIQKKTMANCTIQESEYQANLRLPDLEVIKDTTIEMDCVSHDSEGNPSYAQVFMGPVCNRRESFFVGADCADETNVFFVANTHQDPFYYMTTFGDIVDYNEPAGILYPVALDPDSLENTAENWEAACDEAAQSLTTPTVKTERAKLMHENLGRAFDFLEGAGIKYKQPIERDFFQEPWIGMIDIPISGVAPNGEELSCSYYYIPAREEEGFGLSCWSTNLVDGTYCRSIYYPSTPFELLEENPNELLVPCERDSEVNEF